MLLFLFNFFGYVGSDKHGLYLTLNDGYEIPALGLDTMVESYYANVQWSDPIVLPGQETYEAVIKGVEVGFRFLETEMNPEIVSNFALAVNKATTDYGLKREDLFIATKLPNYRNDEDSVIPKLQRDLRRLKLDYIDLWLMHWPVSLYLNDTVSNIDFVDTWRAMVEAQKQGLTRSIGVANFNRTQIERLITETHVTPAVLEIELNLNLQQPELRSFCRRNGIIITAYKTFGSLLPSKAAEDAPPPRINDPALVEIANRHGKTVPQIVLRYLVHLGVIPLPKSFTKPGLQECMDIFSFKLSKEEKNILKSFDRNYRTHRVRQWKDATYYPFN